MPRSPQELGIEACSRHAGDKARADVLITPIILELFYSIDRGLFAVESEAVDSIPIYNPYTGAEIPDRR